MNKFVRLLFQGILLVAPLGLTFYFLVKGFYFFDSLLADALGISVPGLGLVALVALLVLVGYFGNTIVAEPVKYALRKAIKKVPLISFIYDSLEDIFKAFVGKDKKFSHPVLVKEHQQGTCYKLGFVTQEGLEAVGVKGSLSAVYFPHSYALSGVVQFVENEYLVPVETSSAEWMKFIVSGGVIQQNAEDENKAS